MAMTAKRGYAGSYGRFLEALRRPSDDQQEATTILRTLRSRGGAAGMKELLDVTKLAPIQLVKAVEQLQDQHVVSIKPRDDDDFVELTSLGQAASKLE